MICQLGACKLVGLVIQVRLILAIHSEFDKPGLTTPCCKTLFKLPITHL